MSKSLFQLLDTGYPAFESDLAPDDTLMIEVSEEALSINTDVDDTIASLESTQTYINTLSEVYGAIYISRQVSAEHIQSLAYAADYMSSQNQIAVESVAVDLSEGMATEVALEAIADKIKNILNAGINALQNVATNVWDNLSYAFKVSTASRAKVDRIRHAKIPDKSIDIQLTVTPMLQYGYGELCSDIKQYTQQLRKTADICGRLNEILARYTRNELVGAVKAIRSSAQKHSDELLDTTLEALERLSTSLRELDDFKRRVARGDTVEYVQVPMISGYSIRIQQDESDKVNIARYRFSFKRHAHFKKSKEATVTFEKVTRKDIEALLDICDDLTDGTLRHKEFKNVLNQFAAMATSLPMKLVPMAPALMASLSKSFKAYHVSTQSVLGMTAMAASYSLRNTKQALTICEKYMSEAT